MSVVVRVCVRGSVVVRVCVRAFEREREKERKREPKVAKTFCQSKMNKKGQTIGFVSRMQNS